MHSELVAILVPGIFTFAASSGFWAYLASRNTKESATTRLIMGLACIQGEQLGFRYIEQGYITPDELQGLEKYIYTPYRELGGNGVLDRIMQSVLELPIKQELRHSAEGESMSNTPKPPELDASVMELDEYETVQQKLALLSSKAYDVIKALVQIVIPATSAAYFSLGELWEWPGVPKVVGSLAIVATLLGTLLKLSKRSYDRSDESNDGELVVTQNELGKKYYSFEPSVDIRAIPSMDKLVLKVKDLSEDAG